MRAGGPRSQGCRPAAGGPNDRGFALLLTLTLLAFLVLLLVGLATYMRIETAIASNTQRQTQARENAMLALNTALGQLQKYAGPDQRATATAEKIDGVNAQKSHYTGVWASTVTSTSTTDADGNTVVTSDAKTPLTWLVSGSEGGAVDDVTAAVPTAQQVLLVGSATTSSGNVTATLQDIKVPSVPGQPAGASTTIGRYAWWVGDQGVKAPVGIGEPDALNYEPYTPDLSARRRQQVALGAGAADGGGNPVFEPFANNNKDLVKDGKIATPNQLAFLRAIGTSGTQLGLTTQRQNFHAWSPNNFAVLADVKRGGLREDLSLVPQRLGSAFSAWARYDRPLAVAMEPTKPVDSTVSTDTTEPAEPTVTEPVVGVDPPAPLPPYGSDPVRRRFFITPNVTGGGIEGGVHPVLAFFGMSFSIRDGVAPDYEVSVRCVIGLWNPFTSSLVPPAGDNNRLELRISGLPDVRVQDSEGGDDTVSLQSILGSPTLRFNLTWPEAPTREDEASWLPGRVYYWTAESNTAEPAGGNVLVFNERNSTFAGAGVARSAGIAHRPAPPGGKVFRQCSVANNDNTTLAVQLVRVRDQVTIATFNSPSFRDFQTSANQLETDHKYVDFAYVFRLPDPAEIPEGETATWLSAAARDPRRSFLPGSAFVAGENGPQPEQYGGPGVTGLSTRFVSRLIDRPTDSHDYNEDVPVFELPRGPFLSVGALQHLIIPNARPFAIGNSWGADVKVNNVPANALFDRYFFSGLVQDVVPTTTATDDLILPNPLLKPLRRPNGTKITIDDIRNMVNPPDTTADDGTVIPGGPGSAFSSKYVLQAGAFNVNSTSPAAWAAVLRSIRFPAPQSFSYHNVSLDSGTAGDDALATVQSDDAQFFRFSLSAQETYKAEWPPANAEDGITPPRTDLFRKGMRTLSAAQVAGLAARIVELVGVKHAAPDPAGGPFRSLEEFLAPSLLYASVDADNNVGPGRSLLEAAIADTGINAGIEFSSQYLTQADVMTALAPVLFARSDTFIIRAYGEAVNPATTGVEGRAWCEALVQRVPEFFSDPANNPADSDLASFDAPGNSDDSASAPTIEHQLNKLYGRRFKVVSFRWLTRSDI